MSIGNPTGQLIDQLVNNRAKEYNEELRRLRAQNLIQKKRGDAHEKKQLQLLESIGIKKSVLDRDNRSDAAELKSFLEEARPALIERPSARGADAKYRSAFVAQIPPGIQVLPPYGVFAPPFTPPTETTSGWIFTDASPVKMKDSDTGDGSGISWSASAKAYTPHDVIFTFTPAVTAIYSMTGVFAFHGFYVLRSDDGFFTSKHAYVDLRVSMSAHQYVDLPWSTPEYLINRDEQNTNEFDSYDFTKFFDYSAPLRAGDPVVVTVRIEIVAGASGGGSYAEINFEDGTANYIEPLFLSVGPA